MEKMGIYKKEHLPDLILPLIKKDFYKLSTNFTLNQIFEIIVNYSKNSKNSNNSNNNSNNINISEIIIAIYDEKNNFIGIIDNCKLLTYLYSNQLFSKINVSAILDINELIIIPPIISIEKLSIQEIALLIEKHKYLTITYKKEIIGFITPFEIAKNLSYYMNLSLYDPLTNFYNRNYLNIIEKKLHTNETIGILFIDLDNFKAINDTYGHLEGDRILQKFSLFLKNTFRQTDIIIRYGGDEFLVILYGVNQETIKAVINKIEKAFLEDKFFLELNKKHEFSFSCGFSCIPPCNSIKECILEADKHMYKIKRQKK